MSEQRALLEAELKIKVIDFCKKSGLLSSDKSLINEFTFENAARRADLVIVGSEIIAFEIKSELDTLERLSNQAESYLKYCDLVTVVVAEKYLGAARQLLPRQVALWSFNYDEIFTVRKGLKSPKRSKSRYLDLMTVRELRRILTSMGMAKGKIKREELVRSASGLPLALIRREAIRAIRERYAQTTKAFRDHILNHRIEVDHLQLLSPYAIARRQIAEQLEQREKFWSEWACRIQSSAPLYDGESRTV